VDELAEVRSDKAPRNAYAQICGNCKKRMRSGGYTVVPNDYRLKIEYFCNISCIGQRYTKGVR